MGSAVTEDGNVSEVSTRAHSKGKSASLAAVLAAASAVVAPPECPGIGTGGEASSAITTSAPGLGAPGGSVPVTVARTVGCSVGYIARCCAPPARVARISPIVICCRLVSETELAAIAVGSWGMERHVALMSWYAARCVAPSGALLGGRDQEDWR